MPALFQKKSASIGVPPQPEGAEYPDHFPEELAEGSPRQLREDLEALLGTRNVHARALDLVRYATDASPYRRFPQIVASPSTEQEIADIFAYAQQNHRTVTFRSGGSSLNGQAQSDDILLDVRENFRGLVVHPESVTVRPGEALGGVQNVLARYGRVLGPDPASASVATIGGVLANNAGGMRCSLEKDSYHSVQGLKIVLPSGTIIDTRLPDAEETLWQREPELAQGLIELRDEIRADEDLVARLRTKFSIRNTIGLRLDAFLDADTASGILTKLMIGSEGILGFIAEADIATLPKPRYTAVTWVTLPSLELAADYVHRLMEAGALACELLVSPVLKGSVGSFKGAHDEWASLDDDASALLLEVGGTTEDERDAAVAAARAVLADAELLSPLHFMEDAIDQANAWEIRSGLMPLLGHQRPQNSSLITEDVCFPPARIGEAAKDLMELLREYNYPPSVMGHAAFGNLHFFMTPSFGSSDEVRRYDQFIEEMTELVLNKYDGSLKAEHGTGLNMAPLVEREWGPQAFDLMWRVKRLIDPTGILAPDVQLTSNAEVHLQDFKSTPAIEAIANACIECGFCEEVCPSRHVTTTPRQRIVLRREMARQPAGSQMLGALIDEYGYDAIDMCAADSSCAIACPLRIDTGKMMKLFRELENGQIANRVALILAKNWAAVETAARSGLSAQDALKKVVGEKLGARSVSIATGMLRSFMDNDLVPSAEHGLPGGAATLPAGDDPAAADAVYFPACVNRMFGRSGEGHSLPETLLALSQRAGQKVAIPQDVAGTCCTTPFSSKGFHDAKTYMARHTAEKLWQWSRHGTIPVIVDASSCTHGILSGIPECLDGELAENFAQIEILDSTQWAARLIEHLEPTHRLGRVAVHPNCSLAHMELSDTLVRVASFAADEAFVPRGAGCCGTAGDRGMLHPELLDAATRDERAGLAEAEANGRVDAYVSSNRTCELGMEQITGRSYEHVLYLLEEATR
ncbi:FAD-binding and (Fe-S)-binding domain-containing protein [Corynebacterium sp. TAE3-ERU2]|uniref:FAD-binding and (Fe-S)-binding domain-containing protein n=1 Tax=Corynebacterium sp. TAE3-ERU2 TaxID=2849497 RepID=UPI001C46EB01|nr:FAD-binding and (Fe-S)-binding domain-containing protein [Corynebacterium sp. TAE3-ERU2]MBV7302774.1 FAD-binding oxidoreductase [Corynebacterium sp. TAE3-ERU2]